MHTANDNNKPLTIVENKGLKAKYSKVVAIVKFSRYQRQRRIKAFLHKGDMMTNLLIG